MIISFLSTKKYVLLRVNHYLDSFESIPMLFKNIGDVYIIIDWYYLWNRRCDYIEKHYYGIRGKYKLIDESFNYYLGLLYMSIVCIDKCVCYPEKGFLTHVIIDQENYFNPLNFKIDVKEREYSEYLKFLFFENNYSFFDLKNILYKSINNLRIDILTCRLLYPNYYFKYLDDYNEKKISNIIKRHKEYELFINYCFSLCDMNDYIKKISF